MFVKVHGTKDYVGGNTQSCSNLSKYLEKENEGKDLSQSEYFFNNDSERVTVSKVIQNIDNNVNSRFLNETQAKFYMLSINPSQYELQHMAKLATGGREISNLSEMSSAEQVRYNSNFKEYVNKTMDNYARNFNRGISVDNILYYAKIEQERTFKGTDQDVKNGLARIGEKKPGLQTHAHVIVSRMDKEMSMSLSPLSNSRGSAKHQLNGQNVQVGFNRDNFKELAERSFDEQFNYQRQKGERFREQNIYHGLKQMVEGKIKGKAIGQLLSLDQSGILSGAFNAYNTVKEVNNLAKDLSTAKDLISDAAKLATSPISVPKVVLKATQTIVKAIDKLLDKELTLEP